MISVKTGTQTWSQAEQRTDHKSDGRQTIAANEKSDIFADQNVGEVLNKISDPNWVDPAKRVRNVGNNQLDKDAFMKLLLTQMKNQDPTSPLQSHEMAAQLAQFTSLEKLTNISEGIDNLQKAQAPAQNFEALNLIGKAVSGDSSRIDRNSDSDIHSISFNLANDAVKAEFKIKGADGQILQTLTASSLKSGRNEITWNGLTEQGVPAAVGTYAVEIEAVGSNGKKVFADSKFDGVITGVNFTPQGPVLMIGNKAVPLKDVKQILDPSLVKADPAHQLKVQQKANSSPADGSTPQMAGMNSNLESIGMSQGLINKLNKEGKAGG